MAAPTRRRRPARRTAARRKTRDDRLIIGGILAVFVLIAAGRWVNEHRTPSIAVAASLLLIGLAWTVRYGRRRLRAHRARRTAPIHLGAYQAATPAQFEEQIAALCRRDGCTNVRTVGGAGDLAADVLLTTPDGRRMLIQAKRYQPGNNVGSSHIQMVNGTYRDIHGCQIAAVVTTSDYTRAARTLANRFGIKPFTGRQLAAWADGSGPAPW